MRRNNQELVAAQGSAAGGYQVLRVAYFCAYPDSMAGASRSLFALLNHLPATVVPVVVTTAPGRVAQECRRYQIECHIISPGSGLMVFGKKALHWSVAKRAGVLAADFIPYTFRLASFLRKLNIGLVHANDPRGALLIGPATRLMCLPLVSHLRGRKAYSGVYWQAFEVLSQRIVTVCNAVAQEVSKPHRHKAVTVHDGARELEQGESLEQTAEGKWGWLDRQRDLGALVIASFASVTPFKGYHHWIDAIAQLNQNVKRPLIFLGIGAVPVAAEQYEQWLNRKLESMGIENFTFVGFQNDPFSWYRRVDITVLPSVESEVLEMDGVLHNVQGNEGFPLTHLEAASFGIPVVGTSIGGVAELVLDEVTGLLVKPGDAKALALALERLVEDKSLRDRLGAAAKARVLEHFSVERCVEKVLGVYRALVPELPIAPGR